MPRGGFSSLVETLSTNDSSAQKELRNRVAALENQLRGLGVEPLRKPSEATNGKSGEGEPHLGLQSPPKRLEELDLRLVEDFLRDLGLGQYVSAFHEQGYVEMYSVLHMEEKHMKDLGIAPGDCLKLKKKFETQVLEAKARAMARQSAQQAAPASSESIFDAFHEAVGNQVPQSQSAGPPGSRVHLPGIYKCVHGPRVAIRAAPNKGADMLDTLHRGDVIRVSEIIPPCWARIDEDEIWARWTSSWPRKPKGITTTDDGSMGVDEDELDPDLDLSKVPGGGTVPQHAFVLIEGFEVGINGPLLSRLPDDEVAKMDWPFKDALEARCAEMNAVHLRRQPPVMASLRQRFVDAALRYIGTPYHKRYHDPSSAKCLPGSNMLNSGRFLDNIQLIQQVVDDLKEDFGFLLVANCKPVYCYRSLPVKLAELSDCEPGDLIFYEGEPLEEKKGSGSVQILHVEIFLGGESGKQSIGSLPWNSHSRTKGKDGVQVFEDYRISDEGDWMVKRAHFCSLKSWLQSEETSFVHGRALLARSAAGGS